MSSTDTAAVADMPFSEFRSPVPWHLVPESVHPRYAWYPQNRTICQGVTRDGHYCRNKPRQDWQPEWLWCGLCVGHRRYIDHYVINYSRTGVKPLPTDVTEFMWQHPDLWVRIKTMQLCAPSFVTPERATHLLENDPMIVTSFCDSNRNEPDLVPDLVAYSIAAEPRTDFFDKYEIVHTHPMLRAAAFLRSRELQLAEEEAISPQSDRFPIVAFTEVEAEQRLRAVVAEMQNVSPNFEQWTTCLIQTSVPTRSNLLAPSKSKIEVETLRQQRVSNLRCLLRAAQTVAKTEINGTGPLNTNDTVWALLLLRVVLHAADSLRGNLVFNVYDRSDRRNLVRRVKPVDSDSVYDAVNDCAVIACDLFNLIMFNRQIPSGVFHTRGNSYRYYNTNKWESALDLLSEAAALVVDSDSTEFNQSHLGRTLSDMQTAIWRLTFETTQNYITSRSAYNCYSPCSFDMPVSSILSNSGYVWMDSDIANAASTLLELNRNKTVRRYLKQSGYDFVSRALKEMLSLQNVGLATGRVYIDSRNTDLQASTILEDNRRGTQHSLVSDSDIRKLARSNSKAILEAISASPRISASAANRLASSKSNTVRMSIILNHSHNLSPGVITMLAFDANSQVAREAAKHLKRSTQTSPQHLSSMQ